MAPPLIVSWGGGVNSTALLIGLYQRKIRPDLILFADTGGEKPETYEFRDTFQTWLDEVMFPLIVTVKNDGMYSSLEENCLAKGMLPSLAYGFKGCSDKYKRRPQEKYARAWEPARQCWSGGGKVTKAIGIDRGEERRAKVHEDEDYRYWYPLLEWGWFREDCVRAIEGEGLPVPVKSACFFCPASTKTEVFALARDHPDLFRRALEMEAKAAPNLDSVKGLGRRWSWAELIRADREKLTLFRDPPEIDCVCYDGEE